MDIRKIDDALSVGGQIGADDVAALEAAGFRSLISNRPDGEDPGQPPFAEIAAAAERAGLQARHLPVVAGRLGEDDVRAFARALGELPKPVLAYCRSGTRSTVLWALAAAGRRPIPEILSRARAAGLDLSPLAPRLAAGEKAAGDHAGGTTP